MPLFRFHRGSLEESLKTTIIVKNFNQMVSAIVMSLAEDDLKYAKWGAQFSVHPYPSSGSNFDERIGWYTCIVTSNLYEEDKMVPVGFLSEPFN